MLIISQKIICSLVSCTVILLLSLQIGFGGEYGFSHRIPETVLKNYLQRAVTHAGLLASSSDPSTETFADDLKMLENIGAKFVGRAAFVWELSPDDDRHFNQVKARAAQAHATLPDLILQAAIFEIVTRDVEKIAIPAWVFEGLDLPVENRSFDYEAMLYDKGKFHNHWREGASVPDMGRTETRLWFYYRAVRYLESGVEALHFGQVELMDDADPSHRHWIDLLSRIRKFAALHSRRNLVLCDAHTHGISENGKLLFDFHSYPMRLREKPGEAMKTFLSAESRGDIYRHSLGGISPSGWTCESLPYLVEFDNYGYSGRGGQSVGGIWVWGYDEISWFAHQPREYRESWLREAHAWVKNHPSPGALQLATRRILAAPVGGSFMFHARDFGLEPLYRDLLAGR